MDRATNSLVPQEDQHRFQIIAGFRLDTLVDQVEDDVLDIIDLVASGDSLGAKDIVCSIVHRNEENPETGVAAEETMAYLAKAYRSPDAKLRPDLNPAVELHHVNEAEEMLKTALQH